jgi:hypothetical protein
MIIGGTLIVLALWMAFIWFVDPDGHRNARWAVGDRRNAPTRTNKH